MEVVTDRLSSSARVVSLVVTRRDQSSATEVKEWPFLDAAVTLEMQAPEMAGQLVHRLVQGGGVVGIGSIRRARRPMYTQAVQVVERIVHH